MGFQTILRYSTDVGLQGASSVNEEGKPQQICLQGLQSSTTYYAMADLLEDGVRVAQSEKENFTTLAAGVMSVTYSYYRRNGCNEHVVVYTYSSTYAPSACILHTEGPSGFVANYQGLIDSSNNTVTFEIDDWDGGVNYDVYATLYDIYGEEKQSVTTTLTSGTINTISLTPTAATETTVTLGISKCNDCGFFNGWVDVWLGTKDPDTDPSDFHEYFNETDTSITISGLTANTSYYFRATFYCDDRQTQVVSAAISYSTTAHDYSADYLTIENISEDTPLYVFYGYTDSNYRDGVLQYSKDGGQTWTTKNGNNSYSSSGAEATYVLPGKKLLCKSTNNGTHGTTIYINPATSGNCSVYGNVLSMVYGDNFRNTQNPSIPAYKLQNLFAGGKVRYAENLYIGAATIGDYGVSGMFKNCTNLATPPNFSTVNTVGDYGVSEMFSGCTRLATAPNLSSITTTGVGSFKYMFTSCTALTAQPLMPTATTVGNHGFENMFYGCTGLTTTTSLSNISTIGDYGFSGMFYGCTGLTATPSLSSITTSGEFGFSGMFSGCTGLTSAAINITLTTIGRGWFYNMFKGCTGLTAAPSLSSITSVGSNGLNDMFRDCTGLTAAPSLSSITTVGSNGLDGIFRGCTGLTAAPSLSSITTVGSGGFSNMFRDCTNLTTAPTLPNITSVSDNCFGYMFNGCTSLSTPPDLSKITIVGKSGFYGMFEGCTRLATSPDLSNITTVGDSGMQSMFEGCTILSTPPNFTNVTYIGVSTCESMFQSCPMLTSVPDFSNVTEIADKGCRLMFASCVAITEGLYLKNCVTVGSSAFYGTYQYARNLKKAYTPKISGWDTDKFKYWLDSVYSTGTVYKTGGATPSANTASGVPSGWTSQYY